jgi:lipopolysaccharide/colanic/teichoic acid biosynthesis glycosyltransferase
MRESLTRFEAHPSVLPERLTKFWAVTALSIDLLAVLAACYLAGLPPTVGPAACLIVCGALALCGAYRISFATIWRDEIYHTFVGIAVAAVPLWAILSGVGKLSPVSVGIALALMWVLSSAARGALLYARRGGEVADPVLAAVTPDAQRRCSDPHLQLAKRCFDVALASLGLLLVSPLLAAAAVAIVVESGFPVLFRQERLGRWNSRFVMFKFRTMQADAGSDWARPSDARITRVGAILRRCSIDELPQLINVIRGEMSLVGPRPEMPAFADRFRAIVPHYDDRLFVLPGLTGWAQTHYKRNLEPADIPRVVPHDLFYAENASLVLDAVLVVKTAAEFLFHRAV